MKKMCCVVLLLILQHSSIFSQALPVNRQLFFLDDTPVDVTLATDLRKLRNSKNKSVWQPANIVMKFSDTLIISEEIRVKTRGVFRKNNCDLASLMLNFKNSTSPKLSPLKKMKLVGSCKNGSMYDELLLKEYLVYKIQNLLSNKSFRVRLVHITYKDDKQKARSFTEYAFLMEDMNDMAKRNNCIEINKTDLTPNATNTEQMNFVNFFQYMIGNTDWSIPNCHNIKLMVPKNDTLAKPYLVPYDFDFCGLVNAGYATPSEEFGLSSVQQRLYRGDPRSLDELETTIDIFNEKKEAIMYYINHFELCSARCRELVTKYLTEFYTIIANKKNVIQVFILKTRNE